MIIYEMSDLRELIAKITEGEEDLNNYPFTEQEKQEIIRMTLSVISGGKISIGNKVSFVTFFISQCRVLPSFTLQAPMACNVTTSGLSSRMNIYFNPLYMAYVGGRQSEETIFMDSFETVGNVLLHEAQHLLYNHLDTYEHYISRGYGQIVNIATDCQINQDPVIARDQTLTNYGITLDAVKELTDNDQLKARQDSGYYFEEIFKSRPDQPEQSGGQGGSGSQGESRDSSNPSGQSSDGTGQNSSSGGRSEDTSSNEGEKQPSSQQGQGGIDPSVLDEVKHSHDVWRQNPDDADEEMTGEIADRTAAAETIKDAVEQAIEQGNFDAQDIKDRGLVAGHIIDSIISGRNTRTKLPIKHFIQKGLGRIKSGTTRTYARINRQQSNNVRVLRGRRQDTVKNIHIFFDTSGSVSREELDWTFKEIAGLAHKMQADLYATPFDYTIYPDQTEKIERNGRYNIAPVGRGGTAFQPVFDHLFENNKQALHNDELIVIFTDGGGESHINAHGFKNIVWILIDQTRDVLSIQDPLGYIAYLEDDMQYTIDKMSNRR